MKSWWRIRSEQFVSKHTDLQIDPKYKTIVHRAILQSFWRRFNQKWMRTSSTQINLSGSSKFWKSLDLLVTRIIFRNGRPCGSCPTTLKRQSQMPLSSHICAEVRVWPFPASLHNEETRSRQRVRPHTLRANKLFKKYPTDQAIVDNNSALPWFVQPAHMTLQQYADDRTAKPCKIAEFGYIR